MSFDGYDLDYRSARAFCWTMVSRPLFPPGTIRLVYISAQVYLSINFRTLHFNFLRLIYGNTFSRSATGFKTSSSCKRKTRRIASASVGLDARPRRYRVECDTLEMKDDPPYHALRPCSQTASGLRPVPYPTTRCDPATPNGYEVFRVSTIWRRAPANVPNRISWLHC